LVSAALGEKVGALLSCVIDGVRKSLENVGVAIPDATADLVVSNERLDLELTLQVFENTTDHHQPISRGDPHREHGSGSLTMMLAMQVDP